MNVLRSLATELQSNIEALFDPNWTGSEFVARSGFRPRILAAAGGVTLERLVPNGQGYLLQGNIHIVAPGGGSRGPLHHEGDEFGYVLEGRLELKIDNSTYDLSVGDSFEFPSNLSHTYRNPGLEIAASCG